MVEYIICAHPDCNIKIDVEDGVKESFCRAHFGYALDLLNGTKVEEGVEMDKETKVTKKETGEKGYRVRNEKLYKPERPVENVMFRQAIKTIPMAELILGENIREDVGTIEEIRELGRSIRRYGNLQTIGVYFVKGLKKYKVVFGQRRFLAAKEEGLGYLDCRVITSKLTEKDRILMQYQENNKRKDMTLYEKAKTIQALLDEGMKKDEIMKELGISQRQKLNEMLKVLKLIPLLQEEVKSGRLKYRKVVVYINSNATKEEQADILKRYQDDIASGDHKDWDFYNIEEVKRVLADIRRGNEIVNVDRELPVNDDKNLFSTVSNDVLGWSTNDTTGHEIEVENIEEPKPKKERKVVKRTLNLKLNGDKYSLHLEEGRIVLKMNGSELLNVNEFCVEITEGVKEVRKKTEPEKVLEIDY